MQCTIDTMFTDPLELAPQTTMEDDLVQIEWLADVTLHANRTSWSEGLCIRRIFEGKFRHSS